MSVRTWIAAQGDVQALDAALQRLAEGRADGLAEQVDHAVTAAGRQVE